MKISDRWLKPFGCIVTIDVSLHQISIIIKFNPKINPMKTQIKKSIALVAIPVLSMALIVASCKKSSTTTTTTPTQTVTADDAADAVSLSMESSSGGYAAQVTDGATYTSNQGYRTTPQANQVMSLSCGIAFDTTVTKTYSGAVTASYTHQWHYLLSCDSLSHPSSLAFSGSYNGNYSGNVMTSTNSGNRNWTITGLGSSYTSYTYNGSFTRTGSHTSKLRAQNTFNVNMQMTSTNVVVNKSTKKITAGTGTVNVTCTVSNGNNYSFTGTLTFNTNNTATLVINGNTYTITLY